MKIIVIGAFIMFAVIAVRNKLNIGVDSSDRDGWHRSGLTVRVDHATGVNYFTTWSGQIIQRVNADGTPFVLPQTN